MAHAGGSDSQSIRPRTRHICTIRIHNLDIHASNNQDQPAALHLERDESQPRKNPRSNGHPSGLRNVRETEEEEQSKLGSSLSSEEPPIRSHQATRPGRSISTASSSNSIPTITRTLPRRSSSNETITNSRQTRPGLSHGRSRSRLIVPRPTILFSQTNNESGAGSSQPISPTTPSFIPQSKLVEKSLNSLSSSPGKLASDPSIPCSNPTKRTRSTSVSSLRSSQPIHSSKFPQHNHQGRRERASTIVSQYSIDTSGHLTITDELGFEKYEIAEDEREELGLGLTRKERGLGRSFITLSLIGDLKRLRSKAEGRIGQGQVGDPEREENPRSSVEWQSSIKRSEGSNVPSSRLARSNSNPGKPSGSRSTHKDPSSSSTITPDSRARRSLSTNTRLDENKLSSPGNSPKITRFMDTSSVVLEGMKSTSPSSHSEPESSGLVPFYISHIHRKSLYPTFTGIQIKSDYAPWAEEGESDESGYETFMEGWVESEDGLWERLDGFGGIVDLRNVREVEEELLEGLPKNTVIFQFNQDPTKSYYLPSPHAAPLPRSAPRKDVRTIVERSLRETKMQKSLDLEGLERLIGVSRIVKEAEAEVGWIGKRFDERLRAEGKVDEMARLVRQMETARSGLARQTENLRQRNITARGRLNDQRKRLAERREQLTRARPGLDDLQGEIDSLQSQVHSTQTSRYSLAPRTNQLRSDLTNTLDRIFPIEPLDPSSLLYTILSIPLPIPLGPTSPVPPSSLSPPSLSGGIKVDEETNASALGMTVLLLKTLERIWMEDMGEEGGLVYPLTYVGSRSLVRDNISVITGPRSFPLYAKGVERYRYEYAVFLLNKNIELMMISASIKIQDPRHTLPNLKTLILTLASRGLASLGPGADLGHAHSHGHGNGHGHGSGLGRGGVLGQAQGGKKAGGVRELGSDVEGPSGSGDKPYTFPSTPIESSVSRSGVKELTRTGSERSVSVASLVALTGG